MSGNDTALIAPRTQYDPSEVALVGADKRRFVVPIHSFGTEGERYVVVRLTAHGNLALRELCHTEAQREVWRFPSYEFIIRENSLTASQVSVFALEAGFGSDILLFFFFFVRSRPVVHHMSMLS